MSTAFKGKAFFMAFVLTVNKLLLKYHHDNYTGLSVKGCPALEIWKTGLDNGVIRFDVICLVEIGIDVEVVRTRFNLHCCVTVGV